MLQNDSVIETIPAKTNRIAKPKVYAKPDTVAKWKSDSTHLKDSLLKADSIKKVNSIKLVKEKIPAGFEGKALPKSFYAESWVFVVVLTLFFLLIAGFNKSFGSFTDSVKHFFKKKEVAFSNANILEYKVYLTVFSIGVIALIAFELFGNRNNAAFFTYVKILGICTAFYTLKIISFEFVGHVFFDIRKIKLFKNCYFDMMVLLSMAFFPLIILITYKPAAWQIPAEAIALILLLLFYIFLFIKVFQIFYGKLIDVFYIFLYLCTLEILPLLILFRAFAFVI